MCGLTPAGEVLSAPAGMAPKAVHASQRSGNHSSAGEGLAPKGAENSPPLGRPDAGVVHAPPTRWDPRRVGKNPGRDSSHIWIGAAATILQKPNIIQDKTGHLTSIPSTALNIHQWCSVYYALQQLAHEDMMQKYAATRQRFFSRNPTTENGKSSSYKSTPSSSLPRHSPLSDFDMHYCSFSAGQPPGNLFPPHRIGTALSLYRQQHFKKIQHHLLKGHSGLALYVGHRWPGSCFF